MIWNNLLVIVWWSLVFGLLSPDMSHHRCDKEIALHCTVGVCWQRSYCESRAMQLIIMRPIHCFTAAVPESLHVPIVPVVLFNISYLVNSTSAPHPPGSTLTFQYTHLVLGTYRHLAPGTYMHLYASGMYLKPIGTWHLVPICKSNSALTATHCNTETSSCPIHAQPDYQCK